MADIEFERGRFSIAGTDRGIGIMELAARLRDGMTLPEDVPDTLDVQTTDEFEASAFPNGCHVAEVEVDEETGEVEVVRYNMVNDFGVLINPLMVEGQAHGGVVQGIGQALLETTGLRRGRPAHDRLVHGLRAAARGQRAQLHHAEPSRPGADQRARAPRAAARRAAPARCRR